MVALLQNRILIAGILGWAAAQALKTIIYTIMNRSFNAERLVGDGGMPSAHSATVTAIAVSAGMIYGFGSFEFAISAILAIIVMHDAMGVRRVTGKQSEVINELMDIFVAEHPEEMLTDEKLKELVGHTPLQVAAGFLLGFVTALIYCM
ncbi:MAG: divergent PAP2 family protein [Lachnospiraceae bacterium]|nr:divergent PAP2 family protein [Lachnospiraceae bacterium]MBR4208859.1 divergent PAP2 family protein [Lachnospiraceae bacterium]